VNLAYLAWLSKWVVILFVGSLGATVVLQLLTGRMNSHYLLYGIRRNGERYFSPGRVQLLAAVIGIALQYLLTAMQTNDGEMPKIPEGALQLLGLSNVAYLGGKAWAGLPKIGIRNED
jgi:hypothetical protein